MATKRLIIPRLPLTAGALLSALLLAACAGLSVNSARLPPLIDQVPVRAPDLDVLAVSPEMSEFLDRYVNPSDPLDNRAWNLVWATTDRSVLPFKYDPAMTLTSAETFARKTGNCLSFSNMLVAMARNRGLKAWYQEVQIPPNWSSANSTLLISKHINVVLQGRRDEWIVDVSGENASASRKIRRIDDEVALAQHYNNLGANALIEEDLAGAYAWYAKAIETAPRLPYLWSNLGVVYNRNAQAEDARQAYLHALEIDPEVSGAANNLFLMYEQEGNLTAAKKLQAQVDRHRRKNPYYLYLLSSQEAEQGNYRKSAAILQKAISINDREYRFHYQLARMQELEGNLDAAQASLHRALELAPDGSAIRDARIGHLPPLPEQ